MAFWFVVLAFLFLDTARVKGQPDNTVAGFVSIDCGLPGNSSYKDSTSTLTYSSDAQFIDTGTNHNISVQYVTTALSPQFLNVRSFDTGVRNCYTIKSLEADQKYLVRACFMYGNYDGLNKASTFDLQIGVNYSKRINTSDPDQETSQTTIIAEVLFVSPVDYIQVCLVNIGLGMPFISSLDLRPLDNSMYPSVNSSQSLSLVRRLNAGPTDTTIIRYPDDLYDRMWEPWSNVPFWTEISSTLLVQANNLFESPSAVMQTAVTPVNSSELEIYWTDNPLNKDPGYLANFYFSELMQLDDNQKREFIVTLNNGELSDKPISPDYLYSNALSMVNPIHGTEQNHVSLTSSENSNAFYVDKPVQGAGLYNISIIATANSTLPPILNAIELFIALPVSDVPTNSGDVIAVDAIKSNYRIKRNWNGDPCAPKTFAWDGLTCTYVVSGSPRITNLSLPSSELTGEITKSFSNLKALQILDLSHNNLTGSIPDALSQLPSLTLLDLTGNQLSGSIPSGLLQKSNDGSLELRVGDNANLCFNGTTCNQKKKKSNSSIIAVAIIVPIVVVVILAAVGIQIIYKFKRPPGTSTVDTSIQLENRHFTYRELEQITNNFQREIGRGGFGIVYSGFLVDRTQVAVKLRPQMSAQGVREFLMEAQHLSRIHHKNLVSLLGYCKDGNSLALILEYMSEGSLQDHLIGRTSSGRPLTWRDRIRIALESAQGLEYLHRGCNPPLIHRDVKTSNILLNVKLEAKIADFGMSKAFCSNTDTHVSTSHVIGTPGYVDPEYHMTLQLNEKSDVYSFGVVLLEIVTGQPAIIPGSGSQDGSMNIIQWVRQRLTRGNIESVVDARMQGEYDVNSVWKATDVALKCTTHNGAQRPTMTEVLMQLKECIELEVVNGKKYGSNFYFTVENYFMEANDLSENSTSEMEQQVGSVPLPCGPAMR